MTLAGLAHGDLFFAVGDHDVGDLELPAVDVAVHGVYLLHAVDHELSRVDARRPANVEAA